ncbi:MAG: hypothetical protein ACLFTR_03350 [Candidatus Woesearchaeota archaeon]
MGISKDIGLAQTYYEDGAVETSIEILEHVIKGMKNIQEQREKMIPGDE